MSQALLDYSPETVIIGGVEVPARFEVSLMHPDWSTSVEVSLRADPARGVIVTGLRAGEPDPTASHSEIAAWFSGTAEQATLLADCVAMAAAALVFFRLREALPVSDEPPEEFFTQARAAAAKARGVVGPQHRRRVTRKLLREVAEVYRSALRDGEPPTVAVAEHFTVSHRTAGRYVSEARKSGELGPAVGPTAGEGEQDGDERSSLGFNSDSGRVESPATSPRR